MAFQEHFSACATGVFRTPQLDCRRKAEGTFLSGAVPILMQTAGRRKCYIEPTVIVKIPRYHH